LEQLISIPNLTNIAEAMISMLSVLGNIESGKEIKLYNKGNSFSISEKKPDEIVIFNFEYKPLASKIMKFFSSGSSRLDLDENESKLFRKCAHAAYYYCKEIESPEQLKENKFIALYENYFKSW
jgi:hypothetical protein